MIIGPFFNSNCSGRKRCCTDPAATLHAAIVILRQEAKMERPLTIALLLLLFLSPVARAATPVPANQLSELLSTIAQGKDPAFGMTVAPALGIDARSPAAARATVVIERIAHEIEQVTSAFSSAAPADKIAATRAAVARVSPETARDGAARSFEGNGPSLSVMRQLLFVADREGRCQSHVACDGDHQPVRALA